MKPLPRIASDTGLLPGFIAWCVWDEAGAWLGQSLPRRWLRELVAEANTVYVHCGRFRRRVRGTGDRGRDYLWMFMRHWLAAKLREHRPQLHARMPAEYNVGRPLPERPEGHPVQPRSLRDGGRIGSHPSVQVGLRRFTARASQPHGRRTFGRRGGFFQRERRLAVSNRRNLLVPDELMNHGTFFRA